MGFLQRRGGGPDLTQGWRGDPALSLVFDFDRHALCGVSLHGPVDELSKLGPCEVQRGGACTWFGRGLRIDAENGRVTDYLLVWNDLIERKYAPFAGRCIVGGRPAALGASTSEADITKLFGPPWWRDADDDEILLFYELGPVERQVELTGEGRLAAILVTSKPLLADAAQRQAYGVTRPWP